MSRCFAFLRAINVGGHTVKMDTLRQLFESLGFSRVETFIASGNVVFETGIQDARALEKRIEDRLGEALGYSVATFIRSDTELREIANYQSLPEALLDAAQALNIIFLVEPLDEESVKKVMALKTDIDDFHVQGREIYWACLMRQSESTFSNAVLEKTLRRPSTIRGVSTVKKLAEKYTKDIL